MNNTLRNRIEKTLALAISDLKDEGDAYEFLEDFLTTNEFETLSKRLSIGYWLSKKRSYENIKTNLGASSATIAEVNNLMKKTGFKKAIKKIDADEWATKWSAKIRSLKI